MVDRSAVIIGGGMGGLFTGAFLAKNGVRVTVLEKNQAIGGGLQCFKRKGKIFDTGMHVMGGFQPGGNLYKICRWLGILDSLSIQHVDNECLDEIHCISDNKIFEIPSGKEAFIAKLSEYFPKEKEGIERYVNEIFRLTCEMPLYHLNPEKFDMMSHSKKFTWPADRLIAEFVNDGKLRSVLAYMSPMYGGVKGHTPAYVHALLNVLYINGSSRFVGGSQQLADALAKVIADNNGRVLTGKDVKEIRTSGKKIDGIITADGEIYNAGYYVSAIHPSLLAGIMPEGVFKKGFARRLNDIPETYSAFSLYISLKPDTFRYIDHTCYYWEDYGRIWEQEEYDDSTWPGTFMYMTPPEKEQGEYADKMLVHCVMKYEDAEKWENTKSESRGEMYKIWKRDRAKKIIAKLEKIYPGFENKIENLYTSSPLTIRDYYNARNGGMFGYRKDCNNIMLSQLSVKTNVPNLFLTGQNVNLHGICGVPLTAIMTTEAILGENTIINQINNATKND